jgi:hypothetical protein
MHAERTRSAGPSTTTRPPAVLVPTRNAVAICVVCGHRQPGASGPYRLTCPDCGATVRTITTPPDRDPRR